MPNLYCDEPWPLLSALIVGQAFCQFLGAYSFSTNSLKRSMSLSVRLTKFFLRKWTDDLHQKCFEFEFHFHFPECFVFTCCHESILHAVIGKVVFINYVKAIWLGAEGDLFHERKFPFAFCISQLGYGSWLALYPADRFKFNQSWLPYFCVLRVIKSFPYFYL